jgi:transcriptional regulator with XRE-family HTH domain
LIDVAANPCAVSHFSQPEGLCAELARDKPESARRPDPIDSHVGNRLRLRRKILNLSQEKLAERLGITFQQVQKYEKGTNRIGASRLYQIARILEVPVSFFFPQPEEAQSAAGMSEGAAPDYVMDFVSSSEGIELNRAFAKIRDPKVRRRVTELVRSIAAGESD